MPPLKPLQAFTGPQKPANNAQGFFSANTDTAYSRVSQLAFVLVGIILAIVALTASEPHLRWFTGAAALILFLLAVLGFLRLTRNRPGRQRRIVALAIDHHGVWWTDRSATSMLPWRAISGIGIGDAYHVDQTGRDPDPVMSALELFPVEPDVSAVSGPLVETVLARGSSPAAGLPEQRIMLAVSTADVAAVSDAVGRFAGQNAPTWMGRYSIGIMNTLTGGIK